MLDSMPWAEVAWVGHMDPDRDRKTARPPKEKEKTCQRQRLARKGPKIRRTHFIGIEHGKGPNVADGRLTT